MSGKKNTAEDTITIDARDKRYKELNERIEEAINSGAKNIKVVNVNGQRFIADGVKEEVYIEIHRIAGDDLGAFASGPKIVVYGDVQDGVGNTMNAGKIVIHGDASDIVGHSMRGGKIYVAGQVGYRVGIHMKEYRDIIPIIVVSGSAGDFLGEYMAGGRIILLGIKPSQAPPEEQGIVGDFLATGIHGGYIYIRGEVPEEKLGVGAKKMELDEHDRDFLEKEIKEFSREFDYDPKEILSGKFTKIVPLSHKPFAALYSDSKE